MESAQVIAAAIAGFVSPFVQEILFGAKVSGRLASLVTMATTFIIATISFWATGGFASVAGAPAFNLLDPSAFFGFWWSVWTPVYVISQLVFGITTKHPADSAPSTGPIQGVAGKLQPLIGTDLK